MATAALNRYTPEEYLALERNAEFRNEYLDGRILAMTGASPEHADIVLNLGSELRTRLRPRGCRVFVNDVRVAAGPTAYLYPRERSSIRSSSSKSFLHRPNATIAATSSRRTGGSTRSGSTC